jgi:hypothetical protein
MTSAWSGTIGTLKTLISSGDFVFEISKSFEENFFVPTISEITAWENSIPSLVSCLSDSEFDQIQIILELQMPVGAERADIVLLGGSQNSPKALVVELKQWTHPILDTTTGEVIIKGDEIHHFKR